MPISEQYRCVPKLKSHFFSLWAKEKSQNSRWRQIYYCCPLSTETKAKLQTFKGFQASHVPHLQIPKLFHLTELIRIHSGKHPHYSELSCFAKCYSPSELQPTCKQNPFKANKSRHLLSLPSIPIRGSRHHRGNLPLLCRERCCNKHVAVAEQQSLPSNTVLCNINQHGGC